MNLKQLAFMGLALATLGAGSISAPAIAAPATAAEHGAWKKMTVWYIDYVEIGRTVHYCDQHLELIGTSEGANYYEVVYGEAGSCL
jgi:hypothetical protein